MNTPFKPMADIDFSMKLNEAFAMTKTGDTLLNTYRQHLLNHPVTCSLINSFINEARSCMYDDGVKTLVDDICETINENRVSWQLATACEAINANNSSYNYLNRNAAAQVEKLLEQQEDDVVKYIKAGALKNVMYCEAFRNIVNSVYSDKQVYITEDYEKFTPVSFVESANGKNYFEVLGKIYAVKDDEICEGTAAEVSGDFLAVSRLLESSLSNFDANAETLTVTLNTPSGSAVYTVYEEEGCKKCKREKKDKEGKVVEALEFKNEGQIREHNRMVVGATGRAQQALVAETLEAVAKAYELFESICLLDNVKIITSKNDRFVIIENKENVVAYSVMSNHSTGWKVSTNIVEALDFIKKRTNLSLNKEYTKNIDEQIRKTEESNAEQIRESIENDAIQARKNKVADLIVKFKDDPARLAVLSKIAESLN